MTFPPVKPSICQGGDSVRRRLAEKANDNRQLIVIVLAMLVIFDRFLDQVAADFMPPI